LTSAASTRVTPAAVSEKPAQDYRNHRRFVPPYHFVIFLVIAVNLIYTGVRIVRGPSFETVMAFLMAGAIVGIYFYARIFALRAQDRVIRLEMWLRLEKILPADLKPRIPELTPNQLIGLRFASDAEMGDLMREVLANDIHDREAIKKRIKNWRGDYLRV
jgi:hypothetical protein